VWHGRNSYKRSAKLAQFVIHRGLIISVCQTVFSVASRFEPAALYRVSPFPLPFPHTPLTRDRTGLAPRRLRNPLHAPPRLLPRPRQGRLRAARNALPRALQGAAHGPLPFLQDLLRLGRHQHLPGLRYPGPLSDPRRRRAQRRDIVYAR
jgi:hypothetical protein